MRDGCSYCFFLLHFFFGWGASVICFCFYLKARHGMGLRGYRKIEKKWEIGSVWTIMLLEFVSCLYGVWISATNWITKRNSPLLMRQVQENSNVNSLAPLLMSIQHFLIIKRLYVIPLINVIQMPISSEHSLADKNVLTLCT